MNPSVCVVTLTWNHVEDTVECLRSVLALEYRPLRLVVVDNHSSDGTPDLVRTQFPEAKLIVLPENRGFAGGMNLGVAWALDHGAELILILNNDTVLPPDTVGRLVRASQESANRNVGLFVPKIVYYEEQTRIWAAGVRWRKFPPMANMIGFRAADGPRYNQVQEIELATGCALLVRCEVFECVGMFDPTYFMYHEDYDFSYRVRAGGYRILYVPDACLWHKVSVSAGEGSPGKWYYWAQSAVRFYRRHFRRPMLALISVSVWVCCRELAKGNLSFLPHYWRGLRDGLVT